MIFSEVKFVLIKLYNLARTSEAHQIYYFIDQNEDGPEVQVFPHQCVQVFVSVHVHVNVCDVI